MQSILFRWIFLFLFFLRCWYYCLLFLLLLLPLDTANESIILLNQWDYFSCFRWKYFHGYWSDQWNISMTSNMIFFVWSKMKWDIFHPRGLHCDSSISNHHCQIKQWVSIVQYYPLSALLHFSEVISLFSYFSSHFLDPILSFPLLFGSSFSCYILYTYTLVDERFDNKSKEKQYIRNSTEALYFIV